MGVRRGRDDRAADSGSHRVWDSWVATPFGGVAASAGPAFHRDFERRLTELDVEHALHLGIALTGSMADVANQGLLGHPDPREDAGILLTACLTATYVCARSDPAEFAGRLAAIWSPPRDDDTLWFADRIVDGAHELGRRGMGFVALVAKVEPAAVDAVETLSGDRIIQHVAVWYLMAMASGMGMGGAGPREMVAAHRLVPPPERDEAS